MENLPEDTPKQEKQGRSLFALGSFVGILITVAVLIFSILYYRSSGANKTATTEPTVTPTITPSPTVSLNNADITFEVLNGSGVSGQAAKYGKQLEAIGYKVDLLGNAEGTHTGLSLFISESLNSQKATLIANIQKEFPTASYSGILTDSTSLVRLIIGE